MKEFKGLKLYELYEGRMKGERELVKSGFRLDVRYLDTLKPIAFELGVSISEILRAVVSEWLVNNPGNASMQDGVYKGLHLLTPGELRFVEKPKMRNKELFLEPDDNDKLKWESICAGCSVSELIRAIVSNWMDKNMKEN